MAEACPCGYRYECPCGCQVCRNCGDVPEPGSRVAGAIGRGLVDAAAGYRTHLAGLFSPAIDGGNG